MPAKDAYTFKQDITMLHGFVDSLETEFVPGNIERLQNRIKVVLDRICEHKMRQYVPMDVKQYFRDNKDDE